LEACFERLQQVPPPDQRRQAAYRLLFMSQVRSYQPASPVSLPERLEAIPRGWIYSGRRAVAGLLLAIVLAVTTGSAGLIYAADGAAPGDPLYGLDRALEQVRLSLARDPQVRMRLWLSFAEERLEEALTLEQRGDQEHLLAARDSYEAAISSAIQVVGADPHPVAEKIAELYGVPYEQIMDWLLEGGYGFGEIVHALRTSKMTGISVQELLALTDRLGDWGEVWQELGLIGRPEGVPGGPPEGVPGGPPEGVPADPPEGLPGGPPEGMPGGPPEGVPGGPPEGVPGEPPEGAPGGPPEGLPGGPVEGLPSGPPEGMPGGPPEGMPSGPPEGMPGGPPEGVSTGLPEGVPGGPPEGTPAGPPEGVPGDPPEGLPGDPPEGTPVSLPEELPVAPPAGPPSGTP
jgi:hypothetical protein